MPKLSDIINRVRDSADYQRARVLAANDYKLIADLVDVRKRSGLTQSDVAKRLGISQQAVSKIESHDSDPKLSTLRTYATAIGALVGHAVEADSGQLEDGQQWTAVTFFAPQPQRRETAGSYVTLPVSRFDMALAA